jgi:hypothetical protein
MSLPNELYNLQPSQLLELLDIYYVRTQNGQRYSGNNSVDSILTFISNWLRLPSDPLINVTYLESDNKQNYFYQLTDQSSSKFLNETERMFFLTHRYGKPNNNISMTDAELRVFYSNASSTALIALSDILGVCPTRQDPEIIKELLGDINLKSIDKFHQGAVKVITDCLGGVNSGLLNDLSSPNKSKVQCLEEFLLSVGMLPMFDYDPFRNVYISNISQLNEYSAVQPDKIWNFEEVRNMPDLVVESVIKTLPDTQILNISVPIGYNQVMKYEDTLDLSKLHNRLRVQLAEGAIKFLTDTKHYFLQSDLGQMTIYYGRLVDDNIKSMTIDELDNSILKYGALIDPFDNPIDPDSLSKRNGIIQEIINKTRSYALENKNVVNSVIDRRIFENPNDLDDELKGNVRKLILWSKRNNTDDWFPVAINFNEYFKLWDPLFGDLISDTVEYYKSIL